MPRGIAQSICRRGLGILGKKRPQVWEQSDTGRLAARSSKLRRSISPSGGRSLSQWLFGVEIFSNLRLCRTATLPTSGRLFYNLCGGHPKCACFGPMRFHFSMSFLSDGWSTGWFKLPLCDHLTLHYSRRALGQAPIIHRETLHQSAYLGHLSGKLCWPSIFESFLRGFGIKVERMLKLSGTPPCSRLLCGRGELLEPWVRGLQVKRSSLGSMLCSSSKMLAQNYKATSENHICEWHAHAPLQEYYPDIRDVPTVPR